MAPGEPSRLRRKWRAVFRRLRFVILFAFLALVGALIYVNKIGLPGFIKAPLLAKLRDRGVDLEFSRLRWRWSRGIVAENVQFGSATPSAKPILALKEVELHVDYAALAKLQFQLDALILRQGSLVIPLGDAAAGPRELSLTNIQTELRLLPGDLWQLDHFKARFAGGEIQVTGTITNASAVREWKFLRGKQAAPGIFLRRLQAWAERLEQIHFASPPRLRLDVRGDAREIQSFVLNATLSAPDADSPWGAFRQSQAALQLSHADSNELSHAVLNVRAGTAQTPWGDLTNLILALHLTAPATDTNAMRAALHIETGGVESRWGGAERIQLDGQWESSFTNAAGVSGMGKLDVARPRTRWGGAETAELNAHFNTPAGPPAPLEASLGWWTNIAPVALAWECRLARVQSPRLDADSISCAGRWMSPDLEATQITARLYGGGLGAAASLNLPSRRLQFTGSSDFDLQKISPLLTEKSRHWLAQFSWQKPPALDAAGTLILPEWTNRHPDWRLEVKPTVRLQGRFHIEDGEFRGIPASAADGHFSYSNEVWRLPDLVVVRPEGRVELVHQSDERTRDYYFRIHSTFDLRALRPLLDARQQHGLDLVGFTTPPEIDAEIWGRWYDHDSIGMRGKVSAANFTVRGQTADSCQAVVEYTNRYLKVLEPVLRRSGGAERMTAAGVGLDFSAQKAYVTNGFSTADPLAVARAIGPNIGRTFEHYRFLRPPTVYVHGAIPFRDVREADLHFDVDGGPFEWWKFRTPHISGKADWVGEKLFLENIRAGFYGGSGVGRAEFDFHPRQGADFKFNAAVTDSDLHALMGDLLARTNKLEGMLTARLEISDANSTNWMSWQGAGRIHLRDGLIWEIPVFGILSPVLDAMMPGLGSSRASEGSATFHLTNGVVSSDDLEIRASLMRLRYWGKLDLRGRVDARAEAELLRDTWVFGRFLSLALWPVSKLFEYHITGSLHEPKSEPIFFIPRLVLFPFHPIRTLRDLAPEPDFAPQPPGLEPEPPDLLPPPATEP